ncbi:MAG: 1-acyl-sn-glycerol-3-phosphate acyltransferase [Firmicutes bacterium]|nr:1-acyl-sn-glycerol-3-phosphate acyltransferase [Bacillota bacterium]
MKVFGNIGLFYTVGSSFIGLGPYKNRIEKAVKEGDKEGERQAIYDVSKYWSAKIVKFLNLEINVVNPENLPEEGPVVYVANHQSYADVIPFLAVCKHQVGFIAKDSLERFPVFADWVLRIRSLFIKRGDARTSLGTINEGANMVKDGYSLVIFPEGTRSHCSEMADFKPGALKLATKAKAVVVPVTIRDTYKLFEETGTVKKNRKIDFVVHQPIDTSKLDRKELAELGDTVEAIVRSAL